MRFWYWRRRPEVVRDEVDEELRVHLEMRIDELRAAGLSPEAARRQAVRQFGDLEGTRQYCRRQDLDKENRVQRLLFLRISRRTSGSASATCCGSRVLR